MSNDVIGRGVVELEVRDSGVEAGIAKVYQVLASLGPSATKAGAEASAGVAKIGDGAATAADKVDAAATRATKSIHNLGEASRKVGDGAAGVAKIGAGAGEADKKVDAATRNMIASIQRTTAAMEAGSRTGSEYFRVLASQRGVDPAALKPYLAQLDAVTAKQTRAGMSTGELSSAMRTLPAQFTDIATSLAGGQDPLLVFIQQGGQLKDMFGGVGPAAQAMGQYIAGLVNPLTVSVAAVAALTYAYHVGSQEAQDYANALIATNNAAGATAEQMADMAASIDAYYGTQRAAAEAIAALAETGKVSGDNMERFASVSLQWADATGQSVGDVVEYFSALGKDPVEASLKLDESLRFLTASVLDQIASLVEQGRETEAVSVAQNALADVMAKRTPEMQQNIGFIETSWKGVKNVVLEVLDAMASIGRQQTAAQRLAEIKAQLQSGLSTTTSGRDERQRALSDAELRALRVEQDALESDMRRAATDATRDAEREARRSKGVKAQQEYNRLLESGATRAEKLAKALQGVDRIAADLAADGKPLSAAEVAKLKAIETERYKEPKRRGRTGSGLSSSDNAMASIAGDIAARKRELEMLTAENTVTAKLTATQEKMLEVEAKLGLEKKESTKASLRQQLAGLKDLDQLEQQIAAREKVNKAADEERKLNERHLKSINDDVAATEEQVRNYGLNAAQIAENTALTSELSLAEAIKNGSSAETIDTLRQQADAYRRLATAQAGLQDKKDVEEREKLAADEAKKAADEWQKSADQINQSLSDALMRGFEDGKGFAKNFADSLKATFKTMVLRPVIQAVLAPVAGAVAGMMPNVAQAGGMGGGGGMDLISLAQGGKAMFDMYNGSALSIGNMAAGGAQWLAGTGLGASLGWSEAGALTQSGADAIVNVGNAADTIGTALSWAKVGYDAYRSIKTGEGWGATAGAAIGTYLLPGVGTMLGSMLGGVVDSVFGGGGGAKNGGNYNAVYSASGQTLSSQMFGGYTPNQADGALHQTLDAFNARYRELAMMLGGTAKQLSVNLGFDSDPNGDAGDRVSASLALGSVASERELWSKSLFKWADRGFGQGQAQKGIEEALARMMIAALQQSDLPATYANVLSGINVNTTPLDQLNAAIEQIQSLRRIDLLFDGLARVFPALASATLEARSAIVGFAGGLESLTAGMNAYYDGFFSAEEKRGRVLGEVGDALAKVNMRLPATRAEFRRQVEALDLTTTVGQQAYVAMMSVAGAFSSVVDAAKDVVDANAQALLTAATVRNQLVPALDVAALKSQMLGTTLVSTYGAAGSVSRLFLDVNSGLITFGGGVGGLAPVLTGAQRAADVLNAEIVDMRQAAAGAAIDFAGLSAALQSVDTDTFVATLGKVFDGLAQRIGAVIDGVAAERIAVREAALSVIDPTVMSKSAILQGIAGVDTALPSNAGLAGALRGLDAANARDEARASQRMLAAESYAQASKVYGDARSLSDSSLQAFQKLLAGYSKSGAYKEVAEDFTAGIKFKATGYYTSGTQTAQNNAAATLYGQQFSAARAAYLSLEAPAAALSAVIAQQAAASAVTQSALEQVKQAQLAYADALQQFAVDAGKSVSKLSRLREETVKYYEAQKALADMMASSAAGLRGTVADYRYNQLTPEQQFNKLQEDYAKAYAMALSTDGETLAGYGDKLNNLLNPLLEKAHEVLGGDAAYAAFAGTTIARAEAIAGRLETLQPKDYQADSLAMLGSIDTTLTALDASSRSAEQLIVGAINGSRDQTVAGLHAVVAALTGQTIPAFALGGQHAGGLRLVGENGPELEVTGPSRIYSASQTRALLRGGDGGGNAELVAELRALRAEVASLRQEARATAANTGKTARQLERFDIDGLTVRTDADTPLHTEVVA